MNYTGTIKLMTGSCVAHSLVYNSREERKIIIERWRGIYKEVFDFYELAIIPTVIDKEAIMLKPRESKAQRLTRLQFESVERKTFTRPKAVYDNRQHLYEY